MAYELSIIIPARNEEWLGRTVDTVLANTSDCTEIICYLDGAWPVEPMPDHPRLKLIHNAVSVGQRAGINRAAMTSRSKYICKLDAHCAVSPNFDLLMMKDAEYDCTYIPRMYNFHVFDWACLKCGHRTYQGPRPAMCSECKTHEFERVVVWEPRWSRVTDSMAFDSDVKFCYFREFSKRQAGQGEISPTMSLLGACFFLERKRFWELGGCDVETGSWGQQGVEVALTAQLSGGRLLCNKRAWFSHLFRTQPGFSFPYEIKHSDQEHAREYSKRMWLGGNWPKATRRLSSVVDQFWPVPGWTQEALDKLKASEKGSKQFAAPKKADPIVIDGRSFVRSAPNSGSTWGVCYYTENRCPEPIFTAVQKQILRSINGHQLVSVSLSPLVNFGENIVLGLQRSYLTMFQQILAGLSDLTTDFVALCEHDVLYAKDHFSFRPPRRDAYYYNQNVWAVSAVDGRTLFRYRNSTSQLIADRRLLIDHYRERIARVEKEGFSYRNGFEPGTRSIRHNGYDDFKARQFFAARPNIDIRDTGKNLTKTLWSKSSFRNEKYTLGWKESDRVEGWGITLNRFPEFLADVAEGRI